MKQHLSHWPHQWANRRDRSIWKARLQLRNVVVVPGERRELAPHPQLGQRPRARRSSPAGRRRAVGQHAAEGGLELLALGVLVVDRAAVDLQGRRRTPTTRWTSPPRPGRRAPRPAAAIADRIPVTGTCPLRKPSSAERSSCGSISRSARTTGSPVTAAGLLDRVEPVAGPAHHEQRRVGPAADQLHRHDRVDAAAERDERAARARAPWRRRGRLELRGPRAAGA